MPPIRTPYEDTGVSVSRSQEQIRRMLRDAGAAGVQFSEEWSDPPAFYVRFLWRIGAAEHAVKLKVSPLPQEHKRVFKSLDQRERQAWRGIAHYLEGTLKAAQFGLLSFEDIFLSFIEAEPMGRTIGQVLIPQLHSGLPELNP